MVETATSVELLGEYDEQRGYELVEIAGRTAYKSEDKITDNSAQAFVKKLIGMGHESVLEHVNCTVRYITDRATTHALVRHRIAAYTQESTIYCDYKRKGDVQFRSPFFLEPGSEAWKLWHEAMASAEFYYNRLRELKCAPGVARDVLPNATKTELVATHNIREWRHILRVRAASADSYSMHLLMAKTRMLLSSVFPLFFEDLPQFPAYEKALKMERDYFDEWKAYAYPDILEEL